MLIINNQEVAELLTMEDYMRGLEEIATEYAAGGATCVPRIDVFAATGRQDSVYIFHSMQGASNRLKASAIRMGPRVHYWERKEGVETEEWYAGRPGLNCGIVMLFSTETGEPLAIINEGHLQHMRVGARIGLSAKYLAREDSRTLAVFGAGGMARTNVQGICKVRPIERIRVFSPTRAHREAYAAEMAQTLGVEVIPVEDPREAARGAEIICLCTDSIKPVIQRDWIEPGAHLTQMQLAELDFNALEFFDVAFSLGPPPVPLGHEKPLARGNLHFGGAQTAARYPKSRRAWELEASLRATSAKRARTVHLADLMAGTVAGRTRPEERTIQGYSAGESGTQGLEFVAFAPQIYQEARRRGMGREIPTEWLLQDIRD